MFTQELRNAIVVPPDTPKFKQRTGVLTHEGEVVHEAETQRSGTTLTLPPEIPTSKLSNIGGRWLWAGSLYDHFGHFLVESQSRVWASKFLNQRFDGVLFVPKRPRRGPDLLRYQEAVFRAWGLEPNFVRLALQPVRVESLTVVKQSIALGNLIVGTEQMRATARASFGKDISPEGPENLYVSRSKFSGDGGAVVLEVKIEELLANEGYEIFHPQEHEIETQIARYKAAKNVIFCDGSAAHLFAYVGRKAQNVAILLRRSFWSEGLIKHVGAFSGRDPVVLPAPTKEWLPHDPKRFHGASFVLHNLEAIGAELKAHGFIKNNWVNLSSEECDQLIKRHVPHDQFYLAS